MAKKQAPAPVRVQPLDAAKLAERDITKWWLRSPSMADPLGALVTLAMHTGNVMLGGSVTLAERDLLAMMQVLANDPAYAPSTRFPYTQAQMRQALAAKLQPAPHVQRHIR